MSGKSKKSPYLNQSVSGRFDSKAAAAVADKLAQKLSGKSVKGAVLDFSEATRITAGGIAALKALGEQMRSDGKELIVTSMRTELYKALKVAGISDAVSFAHRSTSSLYS